MPTLHIDAETFARRLPALCLRSGLAGLPRKHADRLILLKSIALGLEPRREYAQAAINAILKRWLEEVGIALEVDHVTLRRQLVDHRFLERTPSGGSYRRVVTGKDEAPFDPTIEALDPAALVKKARTRETARKQMAPPRQVGRLMRGFPHIWGICGGWALDLHAGRVTRAHNDIEIAILRRDQLPLQEHLLRLGWKLEQVVAGERQPWTAREALALPVHETHARHMHRDPRALEVLLNESAAERFLYRREPTITRELREAFLQTEEGLPILAPELVLLYKAKYAAQAPNPEDFENHGALLGPERGAWLAAALHRCHPGHAWLAALEG